MLIYRKNNPLVGISSLVCLIYLVLLLEFKIIALFFYVISNRKNYSTDIQKFVFCVSPNPYTYFNIPIFKRSELLRFRNFVIISWSFNIVLRFISLNFYHL